MRNIHTSLEGGYKMIKVIIVDDESAVHEQLSLMIPWDELGWEVVGHANNGEEARQLTEYHRPNLILTDIKMPLMDGLDFMAWLEQSGQNAKVIVLSGYGEFDISRSAFLLGAYDYLLKPIKEAELFMALSKAVEQIHRESQTMEDQIKEKAVLNQGITLINDEFFSEIIGKTTLEDNEVIVRAEQLMIPLPDVSYIVVLINFLDLDELVYQRFEGDRSLFYFAARNVMHETFGSSTIVSRNLHRTNEYLFLYPGETRTVKDLETLLIQLQQSLRRFMKTQAIIGVSGWKQRLGKLPTAYAEALHALESLRLGDVNPIAFYGKQELSYQAESDFETEWREVSLLSESLLKRGSLREGTRLLGKLEAFLINTLAQKSVAEWKKVTTLLVSQLENQTANEEAMLLVHETRTGVQNLRINQVNALLYKMFEAIIQTAKGDVKTKSSKQQVEIIKSYIDAHYSTVSLEDIAQRFYLHKSYFCSLFKAVTGEGFLEYLTGLRMKHAMLLLSEGDLKTYEIADQVGYSDPRYFSQVFRKHTGMQPTQFRQRVKDKGTP
jgi:two-component system response regulator YesN